MSRQQLSVLAKLRTFRGISQSELGAKLGLSQPYFSQVETGAKQGSPAVRKKISKFFKIPKSTLFPKGGAK